MKHFREEQDSIGKRQVPAEAFYGVQTLRAAENFKITGESAHPEFIRSMAEIKKAAAITNLRAKVIDKKVADAIVSACDEILSGKYTDQFIVDPVQGGAGTSFNMNANEVIANRAIEILGGEKGDYSIVHPNDHVNCGQSTNDAYPSAGKIAAIRLFAKAEKELCKLYNSFAEKAKEFDNAIKMGRTEMQDAVPISFGQSFLAYASAISRDVERFKKAIEALSVINMGGTAIGTCINAHSVYVKEIVPEAAKVTGLPLTAANDLVDATQNLDTFVYVSGIVKSCAVTLSKISNDLRLMSSGPRTGFGEINLPPMQNGSSIMPGKVNPVVPEVMSQISFNIIGNDTAITMAAEAGQLELNAFEPIIFYCLFQSLDTLANGVEIFREKCVEGISINEEKCKGDVMRSIGIITAVCPHTGYTKAAALAKKALRENKSVREVLLEENVVPEDDIDKILNPYKMLNKH